MEKSKTWLILAAVVVGLYLVTQNSGTGVPARTFGKQPLPGNITTRPTVGTYLNGPQYTNPNAQIIAAGGSLAAGVGNLLSGINKAFSGPTTPVPTSPQGAVFGPFQTPEQIAANSAGLATGTDNSFHPAPTPSTFDGAGSIGYGSTGSGGGGYIEGNNFDTTPTAYGGIDPGIGGTVDVLSAADTVLV